MAASIETRRRLRAIRRLSSGFPDQTAEDRLKLIEDIASGKAEPRAVHNEPQPNLMERLAAGQASRSPRVGDKRKAKDAAKKAAAEAAVDTSDDDEPKKKKRDKLQRSADVHGPNRMETGGRDRAEG